MKHINEYKIFESKYTDFKEVMATLNDYSVEFTDLGLNVEIMPNNDIAKKVKSMNFPTSEEVPFYMKICKRMIVHEHMRVDYLQFNIKLILHIIETIISHMKSFGYKTEINLISWRDKKWTNVDIEEYEKITGCTNFIFVALYFSPINKKHL